MLAENSSDPELGNGLPLNQLQKDVLRQLADGSIQEEISKVSGLSALTIRSIVQSAKERLNARSIPHALAMFVALQDQ